VLLYSRGDSVIAEGQKYNMIGKIIDGSCKISFGPAHSLIGQGEVLGEVPFLTGLIPNLSVVACEDCTGIQVIDGDYINSDVSTDDPVLAAKFFRYLSSLLSLRFTKT
jgi:CRP-like cAMP-binding protein